MKIPPTVTIQILIRSCSLPTKRSWTSAWDNTKDPQPTACTTRKPRNQRYSLENRQPIAPTTATAMPPSSSFLRPSKSDSGPISTTESARPMANMLTDRAMSEDELWK
jgi:hypothetical protein